MGHILITKALRRKSRSNWLASETSRQLLVGLSEMGRASKAAPRRGALVPFLNETGFRLQPLIRRTFALPGQNVGAKVLGP
jgi:hypothetical protein